MITQDRQPYLNTRQDSPFQFFGAPTVMRSAGETTDGQFSLLEQLAMRGHRRGPRTREPCVRA